MRIASTARSLTRWLARLAAVVALAAYPAIALGQAPPASYRPHARFDAYGNPPVVPPGHFGPHPAAGPHGHHGPMPDGGFAGPFPMGAGGTMPPLGYDLMNDVGIEGPLVDQRGPHYFDLRAEAVFLSRDTTFGPRVDFTAQGIGVAQTVVLSSEQLDYSIEPGFRVMGRCDIGPLSVFEFGYMGVFGFESAAAVEDPQGLLFSLFSRPAPGEGLFGTTPPTVQAPINPMPATERAVFQSISIESELQSAEMTYRRYWVGFNPAVSGTLLLGFRYTGLREDFMFSSIGRPDPAVPGEPPPTFDNSVVAANNMFGLQSGGDVWIGLSQGLRLGMEGKAGIYNNRHRLVNRIVLDPPAEQPGPFDPQMPADILFEPERFRSNQPAFIAEGSVDLVADILPSWSLRVGYEVLFINSIVLAGPNFNQVSPFGEPGQPTRIPFINDQSSALYHGGHAGIEFIW